jgi:hypothetical protein
MFLSLPVFMLTGAVYARGIDPGTQNLTQSWKFNDRTADDHIGGANGTLTGDAEVFDGTLVFSDKDQWMEMPGYAIALNTYQEITLEARYPPCGGANTGYTIPACFGEPINGAGADGDFIASARGGNKSRAAITCGVITSPWSGESGAEGPEYNDAILHPMVRT